ncbi:hypothetical protein NCCP1664_19760 [Zafaria cholistanensis]|uniref:N-acetyltransferase domain-containing protein n=1 Tax=Zafaria cholistanensis TaxID=1682741 RepID=A0A5A7NRP2_9MICC|nr:GNAT family N-acetyltransferase [Zafaria cholistanensis]GER23480.1 hypothetical protein NCCP1664_19760 [Zafaria cholistanensis]
MAEAWPSIERGAVDGWTLRFAAGVTLRANSVLPLAAPGNLEAAVAEVERRSAERWLDASFQISPATQPADLDGLLAMKGYRTGSPTLVQVMDGLELQRFAGVEADARVELDPEPGPEWLEVYLREEGPGTKEEQAVLRRILLGAPAVYASLRVDGRVESIARMALVGGFGGLSCVVTRAETRRRGHARRILETLLSEAARRDLSGVWLQVREARVGAIVLSHSLGFSTATQYHYRTRELTP